MKIKKIYDLTHPFYHNCPGWPDFDPPTVNRWKYQPRDICNVEWFEANTHTGTHVDAPYHFIPDGKTLDQVPMDTWVGEGVVVDVSYKKDKEAVTAEDLEKIAQHVQKDDIVMLYTGRGKLRGFTDKYLKDWPSVDESGAKWLVERGAKVVGTDGLGIEMYGFPPDGQPRVHNAFLGAGVCLVEEAFLEDIAVFGKKRWFFVCAPLLLKGAGGCFARIIAIDEDN
jgi:kynurenine formamidase